MNKQYDLETKIKACKDYEEGRESYDSLARKLSAAKSTIRRWCFRYREHGEEAFKKPDQKQVYTKEFKHKVVEEYISGESSYADLSAKYNLNHSTIVRWVNKWYNGIELKDYTKGATITMKTRKTTYEERIEIVEWTIKNNMNYKKASEKYEIPYANIYKWTKNYLENGKEALKYKKRGRKTKTKIKKENLTETERLKLELDEERALRKRRELEIEILKKKEELEKKILLQK